MKNGLTTPTGQTSLDELDLLSQGPSRRPLVFAATAFALGIVLNQLSNVSLAIYLAVTLCCFMTFLLFEWSGHRQNWAALTVIVAFMACGGLRHHLHESVDDKFDIGNFAAEVARPVRIRGVITSSIELIESERGPRIPPWMEIDTSRFQFKCEQIQIEQQWQYVSGQLQVDVSGHVVHAQIGDRIEILGELSIPGPIKNPGGFDFAAYIKQQGHSALLRANHPQAVRRIEDSGAWRWSIPRFREQIRRYYRSLFTLHLSKDSKAIALSILLGDRTQLNDVLRDRFVESGTMHLLAISGLHVGILAGLLAVCCRMVNCSSRTTALLIITTVCLYAALTNHRPPVLRAALLISVAVFGTSTHRRIDGFNLLAFCALVLLAWRPNDLFDIGAQLSFLAVGAIIWSADLLQRKPTDVVAGLPVSENWRFIKWLKPVGLFLYRGYVVTAAVWLATLPLTIATFHLVAPIGFLLNILLIPYVAIVLFLGYGCMVVGLLLPPMVGPVASCFDWSVQGLLTVVDFAHNLPYGHYYTSGVPVWWLIGYYLLLAFVWRMFFPRARQNWAVKCFAIWIVVGLALGSVSRAQNQLRFTALSVGHGLATVIELPSGETLLYDAGTLGNGRRAERTLEQYLWHRQITKIDSVIVSHADHDHFSGLFGLIERFPIGKIFISQTFLDFDQKSVSDLCALAAAKEIPIEVVFAGDELRTASSAGRVSLKLLHPDREFASKYDNANSIVLAIESQGHRLLLTGDIEKDGLEQLLQVETEPYDVVMVPHHGSPNSRPEAVIQWGTARHAIISSSDRQAAERVQQEVRESVAVYCTESSGAVTVTVSTAGELSVETFLQPSSF